MVLHGHFVRERLTNALRRVAFLGRTPVQAAGVLSDLDCWSRLTESYVPRRYDGRLCLLVTGDAASGRDRGWSRVARSPEVVTIAGDHFGCITEHIAETADKFAAAALAI
jgi:thioesterase domain-containing protein